MGRTLAPGFELIGGFVSRSPNLGLVVPPSRFGGRGKGEQELLASVFEFTVGG